MIDLEKNFHSERIPVSNAMSFRKWAILLGFIFALLLFIGIKFSNRIDPDLLREQLKDKTETGSLNVDTRIVVNKDHLPTKHRSTKYWNHSVSKIRSIISFTRSVITKSRPCDN